MHRFRLFSLSCLLAAVVLIWLTAPGGSARAAGDAPEVTYVSWLGQGLGSPSSRQPDATQSVTVYARSDTGLGENVCLEYTPDFSNFFRLTCAYSSALSSGQGNWHCSIPAQNAGTTVTYQLFTANDCIPPAGAGNYTGFNWSYAVDNACAGSPDDIKINEVLYDQPGSGVRVANSEWIELVNTNADGNSCVSLDNFAVDDLDNNSFDLPNMRLYGGEYLVLYTGRPSQTRQNPVNYSADFLFEDGVRPPLPPAGGSQAFVGWLNAGNTVWNDGGDEILLYVNLGGGQGYDDGIDTPVDVVQWEGGNDTIPGAFGWTGGCSPNPTATQGISLSLIPGLPSADCASWEASGSSGTFGGNTGYMGSTRGPNSIGGSNEPPSGMALACDPGGDVPVLDGDLNGDAGWDMSTAPGSTFQISEAAHAFPAPADAGDVNSDFLGESAAGTFWTFNGSWNETNLGGQADVRQFLLTADDTYLYAGITGVCGIWADNNGGNDLVDLFMAIDTDNATGENVYEANAPWNKNVDFAGWNPEYIVAVERIQSGNDYAALLDTPGTWNATNLVYGTDWAGDFGDCELEFKLPWSLLGGRPSGIVWNFAIYTTHDADGYDVYDSGPGTGNSLYFEQIGDYPDDADYACGTSDPVNIAAGVSVDEPGCNDGYGDSDNSYVGDDPTDGGNEPGSDTSGNDTDTIMEYYAVAFDNDACSPLAITLQQAATRPHASRPSWLTAAVMVLGLISLLSLRRQPDLPGS
ncbi:MAG: lamin tail domain-containing protein [Ardenticatenales bacterium]|nr:lamin tail domain-containing protein [Ardenticatenales bacterium]